MASQDCQVCLEPYDDKERRPRCLSCGHTLCTSCVADTITCGPLYCPFCRIIHSSPVSSADDVPVNYTVVSLLQDNAYSIGSQRSHTLLTELKKEANEFTTAELVTCNCHLTRLVEFKRRLSEQRSVHQVHIQALRSLIERNESLLEEMTRTADQVSNTIAQGMEKRAALEAAQARVNASSTLLEVTAAHHYDRARDNDIQEWGAAAHQLLQSQVIVSAREVEHITSAALQAVVGRSMSAAAAALTPTKTQMVDDLPDTGQLVVQVLNKARLVGSGVWTVMEVDGRPRCAKMVHFDDRVYLSALREGKPPIYSHTIPYVDVRGLVDETCVRIFLELSWGGEIQGRVCIKLLNTAPRTRQFFFLCSGERGPSYANTNFLEVESRGQPGERVWGGDYEKNDGSGGSALPGLLMGDLNVQTVTAGLVAGFCYGDEHRKPSHFVIYNNDCPIAYEECPIGKVENGMDLVRAAAKLVNMREATISDCGIVLCL
ncbi:tripartite motif-containing protein 3-like [Homarus americanus]|uniref:tripartite motif-containing protein 3-like n=1 Tax=Homarus americanus TaxID=6706 RepID=UPI001C45F7F7|nr:tripartite motif-containing protein 3-like [Homarus americanus]